MGKYTAESTGMAVLRPIATEKLQKCPDKKKRIWSEELEAWGFFVSEEVTQQDMFLLWCSVSPGDRLVFKLDEEKEPQISTVVGVWRETEIDKSSWIYRLIDQSGRIVRISIDESELFKQASKLMF